MEYNINTALVLDNIPAPILVYDLLANVFLYSNNAFSELFDVAPHTMHGKKIEYLDLYMSSDERNLIHEKLRDFSDASNLVVSLHYANAFHKYLCSIKVIIQDESAYGICLFHQALTLPAHEQEETRSSSHPWLSESTNHQLRSLLTTIINIGHLTHGEQDVQYTQTMLHTLVSAGEKALAMLDLEAEEQNENLFRSVLEFHRYDIVPTVKEIIYKYTKEVAQKKIHLKLVTVQKEMELYTDLRLFTETIDMLLALAVRSTSDGEVRVDMSEVFADGTKKAAIKIADTGIGVKSSHLEILSQYTVYLANKAEIDEKATLEVLVKCKALADRLSAGFQIQSQYGKGTEVTITFPIPPAEESTDAPQNKETFVPEVLLVDDDQLVFRIIQRYLTGLCNLDYAIDGRRAIMAVARKKYDIIFMDINLGVGLTGLQVIKKLKELPEYADVPMVAITAMAMPGDKERALAAGCSFYQAKPFRREDIINVFNECLGVIKR